MEYLRYLQLLLLALGLFFIAAIFVFIFQKVDKKLYGKSNTPPNISLDKNSKLGLLVSRYSCVRCGKILPVTSPESEYKNTLSGKVCLSCALDPEVDEQSKSSDIGLYNARPILFSILFLIPVLDYLYGSNLPYEYFMLLRLVAVAGFGYYSYDTLYKNVGIGEVKSYIIFLGLAALYNPFIPVELTRELWTLLNLATAIVLIIYGLGGHNRFDKQ